MNFPIGLKLILFIFFIPLIIKQFKLTKNIVMVTFITGFIIYAIELISIVFFPIIFYPLMPKYTPNNKYCSYERYNNFYEFTTN